MNNNTKPLLFITLTIICFLLGSWQIYRLNWKNQVIKNLAKDAVELSELNLKSVNSNYTKVTVHGHFINNKNFTLLADKGVFQLLTPFKINHKEYILVNRGKIKQEGAIPQQNNNTITLEGHLICHFKGIPLINNMLDDGQLFYIDIAEISKYLDISLKQCALRLAISIDQELNDNGEPSIYNHHIEYAIMWFLLSLSGIVIFIVQRRSIQH